MGTVTHCPHAFYFSMNGEKTAMSEKKITITNKSGENIGTVFFKNDVDMVARYNECADALNGALVPLVCLNITNDGNTKLKSGKRILRNAEKKVFSLFDTVLGYEGAYKAFFTVRRPFARAAGGQFYCLQCLQALKQIIEKEDTENG